MTRVGVGGFGLATVPFLVLPSREGLVPSSLLDVPPRSLPEGSLRCPGSPPPAVSSPGSHLRSDVVTPVESEGRGSPGTSDRPVPGRVQGESGWVVTRETLLQPLYP